MDTLLAADNVAPKVTLAARPGLCEVDELVAAGGARTPLSPLGVTLPSGDPGELPAVAEGRAGVQDEGSQVVALALAAAPVDGPDQRWLDLCAGPGGKAALLAALAGGSWGPAARCRAPGAPGAARGLRDRAGARRR